MSSTRSATPVHHRDWFWLILLFLLVSGLFIPHLIQGLSALDRPEALDIINQWVPFKAFIAKAFHEGSFPLWDPHDLCGMPFLAFSHTGSLYPPGLLIYALGSIPDATSAYIFFHLLVAAFSMYIFLRHRPRQASGYFGPAIAFLGAAAYTFSGFTFANINFLPSLATASWLPLLFLGIHLLIRDKKGSGFILTALATFLCLLGGDAETLIYALMGTLYYALVLASPGSPDPSGSPRSMPRAFLIASLAISTGIFLALVQFLPLVELNHFSIRGKGFFPQLSVPAHWWTLLAPFAFIFYPIPQPAFSFPPNQGLDPWYLGFIFFPFFILALSKGQGRSEGSGGLARRLSVFFILFLAYLIFMFAPPFHDLASRIPILRNLIVPPRAMPVLEIYFFYIAALGLERFFSRPSGHPRSQRGLLLYFLAYGVIVIAASFEFKQALIPRLALAGILLSWPLWKKRIAIPVALILFFLVDVYAMAWSHIPRTGQEQLRPHPELESLVRRTGLHDRYFILAIKGILDPELPFHLGMRLEADTIDSWVRSPPRYQTEVLAMILPGIFQRKDGRVVFYDQMAIRSQNAIRAEGIPLFSLLNVRWFISPYQWSPRFDKIRLRELSSTLLNIYENQDSLPRAFILHRCRWFPDSESLRLEMEQGMFDMDSEVLLVRGPNHDQSRAEMVFPEGAREEIAILKRPIPDQLFATARLEQDGYLFLSESWYPGWQVWVDGVPARIERADHAFRAVRLERGRHELEFSYQPASFRIGLWTSIAGLMSFIGFACILVIDRKNFGSSGLLVPEQKACVYRYIGFQRRKGKGRKWSRPS